MAPCDLEFGFASLLPRSGDAIEDSGPLVRHANSRVTEIVCRKELRPVLIRGARAMDPLQVPRGEGAGMQAGPVGHQEPRTQVR